MSLDNGRDDLFRRFAALKSPSSGPDLSTRPKHDGPSRHVVDAAIRFAQEDDDLARIAEGRPLNLDRHVTEGTGWADVRPQAEREKEEDRALHERLRSLGGGRWSMKDNEFEDDIDVEDYLAAIAQGDSFVDPQPSARTDTQSGSPFIMDRSEVAKLGAEANELLRTSRDVGNGSMEQHFRDRESGVGAELRAATEEDYEDHEDAETEEEILERALAEAALEGSDDEEQSQDLGRTSEHTLERPNAGPDPAASSSKQDDTTHVFAFPEIPTSTPVDPPDGDNVEPELDSRMRLLLSLSGPAAAPIGTKSVNGGLPSVPNAKPGVKTVNQRQAGQGWNLPGYEDSRDDDLDSWCYATVICPGCEDDVYCEACWRDGHGPGDEGHRARRFNWTQKKRPVGI